VPHLLLSCPASDTRQSHRTQPSWQHRWAAYPRAPRPGCSPLLMPTNTLQGFLCGEHLRLRSCTRTHSYPLPRSISLQRQRPHRVACPGTGGARTAGGSGSVRLGCRHRNAFSTACHPTQWHVAGCLAASPSRSYIPLTLPLPSNAPPASARAATACSPWCEPPEF
jgi:hypothetical protein